MRGSVFPRPAKLDAEGRRQAAVKRGERYQLPDGTWTVATSASTWAWSFVSGSKAAGTRRKHTKGGYPTKGAAQKALAKVLAQYDGGAGDLPVRPQPIAVGTYLQEWLDHRAAIPEDDDNHLKPSTLAGYRDAVRAWITPRDDSGRWLRLPFLGAVQLDQLSPDHLVSLYAELRRRGKRCRRCDRTGTLPYQPAGGVCPGCDGVGGHPLATRSLSLVHVLLRMALDEAVEAGKLARNPADRLPKRQRPRAKARQQEDRCWDPNQARRFLEETAGDRLGPLWALALDTGARRGELAALTWRDVDLDQGVVAIRGNRVHVGREVLEGSTKSGKARQVDVDPRTVEALRRWKATQAQDRLAAGSAWEGAKPGTGSLWTDELGRPYRPDILSARFEQAQRGVDVPRLVLHGLRHTSATMALEAGVPVQVESKRLGHADVKVTLGVYAHVLERMEAAGAAALGAALYGSPAVAEGGS